MARYNARINALQIPSRANQRKRRVERERDPVKLVMARGLNTELRRQPVLDDDGNPTGTYDMVPMLRPKGVVLQPVQAMALAQYIAKLNYLLELATAEKDEPEDSQAAEEIVTGMEGQAVDLSKLGTNG